MTYAQALLKNSIKFARQSAEIMFLKEVDKIMNRQYHWISCPDCDGLGYREKQCDCSPNPAGCEECNFTGYMFTECSTCHGDREVMVCDDELDRAWGDEVEGRKEKND